MKKALEVAKEISRKYPQDIDDKRYKTVFCESVGEESADEFLIRYQSKELSINASNARSAAYAISQLKMYVKGQRPQDVFNQNTPLYPLRPIWVQCDKHVALTENVGCYLPSFFLGKKKDSFDKFCHRLLELGCNAIILGSRHRIIEEKSSTAFKELAVLQQLFDDYGIQLIIKPVVYTPPGEIQLPHTPSDELFSRRVARALSDLQQVTPSLRHLLWESVYCDQDFHYHPSGRQHSKFEKVTRELRLVEECLSDDVTLIYHLPTAKHEMAKKQALWFERLLNEAGPRTICAFSSVSGAPAADHLNPHPFWEVLYKRDMPASTPVMPILNSGGVKQGEGYWPNFPLDLFEEYLPHQVEFPIAGFILTMRNIPKKGSLADASAWVAGMSMWRHRHPKQLLETWYRGHFPEGDFSGFLAILKKARLVILELSAFDDIAEVEVSPEEAKSRVDTALAMIKEIDVSMKKASRLFGTEKGAMTESFQLFIKDARRKVLQYAYHHDVSISSSTGPDFKGEGIWTQLSSGGIGEGALSAAGRVTCFDEPNIGAEGSPSHKVHREVNIEV